MKNKPDKVKEKCWRCKKEWTGAGHYCPKCCEELSTPEETKCICIKNEHSFTLVHHCPVHGEPEDRAKEKIPCTCPKGGMYEREDGSTFVCDKCDGSEWIDPEQTECKCCEACKSGDTNDHHCRSCPITKVESEELCGCEADEMGIKHTGKAHFSESEVSDEVFTYFGKNDSYWRELEDGTIQKFDKENGWITWKPETDCIPKKELAEMLELEDETGSMNDDGEYYYDPLSKARNDLRKELKDKFNL